MSRFTPAGQAEILRASQKDDVVINMISEKLTEQIVETVGNTAERSRLVNAAKVAAKYAYYCCTTLAGFQTVGEEYSGIVLVDDKRGLLPSKAALFWMVFLKCSGPSVMAYLVKLCEEELKTPTFSANFTPEAQVNLKTMLRFVKETLPYLVKLNIAVFYLYGGKYYDLAKRLAGIHYVLVRFWMRDRSSRHLFKILGVVSLFYFTILMVRTFITCQQNKPYDDVESKNQKMCTEPVDPKLRCYFCLEKRRNTSATPCGHLFCWQCLMEGLQVKNECPVCREKVQPSRVILLQNYD